MPANTLDLVTELTLRRAAPADLQGVLALLARTAGWLNGLGVRQWPAGGFPAERIEPLIDEGVMYVLDTAEGSPGDTAEDAAGNTGVRVPVATIAVDGHADPEFWTQADRPGDALYVHKLAVSRDYSGCGLGEALLGWAALRAAVHGRSRLRLDCAKDNARLQSFYRRAGFRHVRTVDLPHRASGALFERDAPGALRAAPLRRRAPLVPAPRSGHAVQPRRVLDITTHNELMEC
ncbi:GNAT family N-acetyltransferase [Microbispora sp. H11081]|uniref:GNAT family N-acetyltransferase n=1 Tax=Microbispora sp. H11081 TaxID=2729107 RepID=UPI001475979E|nr:GNAT family N-acetyltransferase [Microbispora sp. H11081]